MLLKLTLWSLDGKTLRLLAIVYEFLRIGDLNVKLRGLTFSTSDYYRPGRHFMLAVDVFAIAAILGVENFDASRASHSKIGCPRRNNIVVVVYIYVGGCVLVRLGVNVILLLEKGLD